MSITRTEGHASRLEALATPRARRIAAVVSFALLTAISAKVAVPIPGTAIPFTFQTLAVILAGALLGARLGAASQVVYLMVGLAGLPVFFAPIAGPAYLLGPTGGYLIAYPLAAYVTGRFVSSSMVGNLGAMLLGVATIYAGGVSWLAVQSGWGAAISLGLFPFIAADLVKVVLALAITSRLRDRCRSLFAV